MAQLSRSPKQLGAYAERARPRGLTQQALADLVGTGQKTISKIENGHDGTRVDTLFSVLAALDCDMQIGPRSKGAKSISEIFRNASPKDPCPSEDADQ